MRGNYFFLSHKNQKKPELTSRVTKQRFVNKNHYSSTEVMSYFFGALNSSNGAGPRQSSTISEF
jgi:hypothetical protein